MGRPVGGVALAARTTGSRTTNAVRLLPSLATTQLLSHLAVSFGFGVVEQVFVYLSSKPARFRVATCEQLDVPVHAGKSLLPLRGQELHQGNRAVPVAHGVVRVEIIARPASSTPLWG